MFLANKKSWMHVKIIVFRETKSDFYYNISPAVAVTTERELALVVQPATVQAAM